MCVCTVTGGVTVPRPAPVAAGGGWGGLAFPPSPPVAAVGGSSGVVRARVAALEAGAGAVATRTFPLLVRTRVVDAETQTDNGTGEVANGTGEVANGTGEVATQTDDMVLWSCHSCSQK